MKCPVCKTECDGNHICKICGFSEVGKVFINQEEAEHWFNSTVIPFKDEFYRANILQPINWANLFCQNAKANAFFNITIPAERRKWLELNVIELQKSDSNAAVAESRRKAFADAVAGHISIISKNEMITKHFAAEVEKEMALTEEPKPFVLNGAVKEGDLAAVLTSITDGGLLVIEVEKGIKEETLKSLLQALDSFTVDIRIGKGPSAKSIRLDLPVFTSLLIAKSKDDMPSQLLDKVDTVIELNYSNEELMEYQTRELAASFGVIISKATLSVLLESTTSNSRRSMLKFISDYLYLHSEIHQPLSEDAMRQIIKNIY